MGRNRRRRGGQRRPRGREQGSAPRRTRRRWRQTIDSFGGFLTIGVVGGVAVILALVVLGNPLTSISDDPLVGEPVQLGRPTHVDDAAEMQITPGDPPAGGPHFPRWLCTGIYRQPVADGYAVHAMEHGVVWITYNPALLDQAEIAALEDVAGDFGSDVILSPRPGDATPVEAVSWGQLFELDSVDADALGDFVRTNRNRSPEPGVRAGCIDP